MGFHTSSGRLGVRSGVVQDFFKIDLLNSSLGVVLESSRMGYSEEFRSVTGRSGVVQDVLFRRVSAG